MLYETIFKRRSVRKYKSEALNQEVLIDIKNYLDSVKQLEGLQARFEIVDGEVVKDKKAPHYILAYCAENTEAYINVGYVLQEVDLYIQSKNLGSLWLGMAKPKEKEAKQDYCIMLAFGKTDVPLRNGEIDFNRLEVNKISNQDNEIIKAARLAPSAVNSQPWQYGFVNNRVLIDYKGRGLLKGMLRGRMSKIDIGIAAKITELALIKAGKTIQSIAPSSDKKTFGVVIEYS